MTDAAPPGWIYNETVRMFATAWRSALRGRSELVRHWGRAWGVDNDVGKIRSILMHRPGPEMNIVDPTKRIESIGSYGDLEKGWYFQSDSVPPLAEMQAQHDVSSPPFRHGASRFISLTASMAGGSSPATRVIRSSWSRAAPSSAAWARASAAARNWRSRGRWPRLGIPILRTLSGSALMEGGSFAWINPKTAVIGCGIRVNREGAEQVGEVLKRQGVELLAIDLVGYDIHIDGSFLMIDHDLALVDPFGLPFSFLEKLKELKVRTIEITPADNKWIINSLAVAPGELIMPEGATNRTLDRLAAHGIRWTVLPYAACSSTAAASTARPRR